jgi:Flp pilus assembly protein TadB
VPIALQIALYVVLAVMVTVDMVRRRRLAKQQVQSAELSPAGLARARKLIAAGKPVQAVRAIRKDTNWPLKKAADTMERLRDGGTRETG